MYQTVKEMIFFFTLEMVKTQCDLLLGTGVKKTVTIVID